MRYYLMYFTSEGVISYKVFDNIKDSLNALFEDEDITDEVLRENISNEIFNIKFDDSSNLYSNLNLGNEHSSKMVFTSEYYIDEDDWGNGTLYNEIKDIIKIEDREGKLNDLGL